MPMLLYFLWLRKEGVVGVVNKMENLDISWLQQKTSLAQK